MPAGRGEVVVTTSGVLIVIESGFCCGCEALSVTRKVGVDVPALVGVPLITPALDSASPPGKVPEDTVHEYGGDPPEAAKVCE